MVGIRKILAALTVLMMVACTLPAAVDTDDSDALGDNAGVLLFQVNPWGDSEGFTLKNYSQKDVDIKGYTVSDGEREGTVTFSATLVLHPGDTVTYVQKMSADDFAKQKSVYTPGTNGIEKAKSFSLNNKGDDLVLKDASGKVLDFYCYGNFDGELQGWTGSPDKLRSGYYCQRSGDFDSDSSDDWFQYVPGQTNLPFEPDRFRGDVTPFLFPDSGGIPVYRALEQAQESVYIQMYEIRSENVCALLLDLLERGVRVSILHEGEPVGNTVLKYIAPQLRGIVDAGAEVSFIGGTDSDRYENMHAKYAVIDDKTVIVTSENWSGSNMNGKADGDVYSGATGNRGWGAVVDSPGYALYMKEVFANDSSTAYGDVTPFLKKYPEVRPKVCDYVAPAEYATKTYTDVPITPVVSNDNSYEAIEYYISNAQHRVYSEQQNLTGYYAEPADSSSPIHMMAEKAAAGLDTRFILGCGFSKQDRNAAEDTVKLINYSTQVSAATMDKPYVHNKGLICDDTVWVSSINWTPASVNNNRECCVVLHSQEIADFFAETFVEDFDRNYSYDGFRVDSSPIPDHYDTGANVFEVVVSPAGDYTYEWDFGDGGTRTTTIPKVVYEPAEGAHVLTVKVTSADGVTMTVQKSYYVGKDPGETDPELPPADPDKPGTDTPPADPDKPGTDTPQVDPDKPGTDVPPADPDKPGPEVPPADPDTPGAAEEEGDTNFIAYLLPVLVVVLAIAAAAVKSSGKKKGKGRKKR